MSGSEKERKDEGGVSDPAAVGDSGEMRWSGSLQRGTWSSVTPGAMAAAAAAAGGERCYMAIARS